MKGMPLNFMKVFISKPNDDFKLFGPVSWHSPSFAGIKLWREMVGLLYNKSLIINVSM